MRNSGNGGDPNFNWRGVILLAAALILIAGALFFKGPYSTPEEITPDNFLKLLNSNQLAITKEHPLEVLVDDQKGLQYLSGYYKNPRTPGEDIRFRTPVSVDWNPRVLAEIQKAGIEPTVSSESNLARLRIPRLPADRRIPADSLLLLPAANPHGWQRRPQLWQEPRPHDGP